MDKKTLHPLQEKIRQIYKENNGALPAFRELAKILGVSSTNTVAYHINQLKKRGELGIAKEIKGVVLLNIKNILELEGRPGVFVLLKNKKMFYAGESNNIKKSLIEILDNNSPVLEKIKENPENIYIAYHIIENPIERSELKNYLLEKI
jgi:SOS-response transcriptional repressor LexA